ncbi:sigma-70 family RNA polymerase sigma factor [Paenarthrobacter sp. PH39-S1]|nr:sigma-70 family RNA polymerase sigma factor [Paenarthrobacter sp. PH39-S1]MDJ0356680.1 sigma-70 family RNA polymerase sigma factor [Paenarthrobacter sp. PH39-S1]
MRRQDKREEGRVAGTLEQDFAAATEPFRRELVVHCYRMLGSVQEAEDVVQEALLRAWRSRERYDPTQASIRTWLYRITTNACLSAMKGAARRPLPSGLGAASDNPEAPLVPDFDVPWLQPLPNSYLRELIIDPGARAVERESVRLALVGAMQLLPPKQRAVLVLRDVLQFSAAEVAGQVGITVAAVNSALQRARATLVKAAPSEESIGALDGGVAEGIIQRYIDAFEAADVAALIALLTDDVVLEMPPVPLWYRGRQNYGDFMSRVFRLRGASWRILATSANGQWALAAYCADRTGTYVLHTLQIITVSGGGITRNVVFQDPAVFHAFRLEPVLPVCPSK